MVHIPGVVGLGQTKSLEENSQTQQNAAWDSARGLLIENTAIFEQICLKTMVPVSDQQHTAFAIDECEAVAIRPNKYAFVVVRGPSQLMESNSSIKLPFIGSPGIHNHPGTLGPNR